MDWDRNGDSEMTDTIRLIIAGSRDFNDYELLKKEVDKFLFDEVVVNHYPDLTEEIAVVEIVSGGARGADKLGEKYANLRGLPLKIFKADWEKHRKSAGYIRNEEMAKYANYCICFWNGSPGTKHMINLARKYKLELRVVNFISEPVPVPKKYVPISKGVKEE